jgi:iron complex outermembrane receptor protein
MLQRRTLSNRSSSLVLAAVLAGSGWGLTPALAQEQPAAAAPSAGAVDTADGDIVVTARRREERLVDVPVAVTSFSATS